ncbi:putative acyl-CoA transferase/carnitine dehydratase [Hoeflea sp. IMCC20628]|uniref:CaiB/BaiF CoA transferase family protein n=1 Tax=Hoeflea sp. IMCC20628 TaxID=1620421 RepID=UPI00063AFDE1|nr:CaiB/BaiF CoA-transferase family protein [Hoeflea sp. IMCC20628]AKH99224.1 putative acyl-CoA transferase/carnitine dehydratase [Hoeflea sp. IMCC20628]
MTDTSTPVTLPLEGLRVLDFAQFLAGPMAALRLADLGAEVIKVERPQGGDLCRKLVVADQMFAGDSLLFHTINRNKRSMAADLKNAGDLQKVRDLIVSADVMIHNFRPGVMERIGLDHKSVQAINPRLVYGTVTGYGEKGPWRDKPGQDLLVQSLSGLTWLSGNRDDGPVPVSFAVLDMATGNHLVQGILAALVRRGVTGKGGLVEVDLMSSAIDAQFEQLTSFFNGDRTQPPRSAIANASVHAAAPYGIYETADGHIAIAMTPIAVLADLLQCKALAPYRNPDLAFSKRNEIKAILADFLESGTTGAWLSRLEPADVWCAEVLDWPKFSQTEGFAALDPLQEVVAGNGATMTTTRCPIRIDGHRLASPRGAPSLGEYGQ